MSGSYSQVPKAAGQKGGFCSPMCCMTSPGDDFREGGEVYDVSMAIEKIGFGRFQLVLMACQTVIVDDIPWDVDSRYGNIWAGTGKCL